MVAALVSAVGSGRLPYQRLAEAAGRVRALAGWARSAELHDGIPDGEPAGVRAARRAVVAVGDVSLRRAPVVVELQDEPSFAAGEVPWGVGRPLVERLPGTVVVPVFESGPEPETVLAGHGDRPVVVSVRGVRRRSWQARAVAAIRQFRPDVVVVDHELPADSVVLGERYVLAYGAARVTAEAAADLLAAGVRSGVDRSRPDPTWVGPG
jgi:beta-N-acetylhexosaminidase